MSVDKEKLQAKLGQWFSRAKEKYEEELENPDSKVSIVARKLAILNAPGIGHLDSATIVEVNEKISTTVQQKTESIMVQMGMDEPLKETEFGMANPYRTGLEQFLALEEAKKKEQQDAEEEKELIRR